MGRRAACGLSLFVFALIACGRSAVEPDSADPGIPGPHFVPTAIGSATATPVPVPVPVTIWNSWQIVTQSAAPRAFVVATGGGPTATLRLYESTNDFGVDFGAALPTFTLGTHSDPSNKVDRFWSTGAGGYPYIGRSTVGRGSDTGESLAPLPLGVLDLSVHTPNNDHEIVAAFMVPTSGTYSVATPAARNVQNCGTGSRLSIFNAAKTPVATIDATNTSAWITGPSVSIGVLSSGDQIYFGVNRQGSFVCDPTEISFSIERRP